MAHLPTPIIIAIKINFLRKNGCGVFENGFYLRHNSENAKEVMDETEFEHMAPHMRQTALVVSRRFGATDDEAEDTAQDVLLKLWSMRDQLDRYHSIESLVAVMARNITISALRLKRTQPIVADEPSATLNAQEQIEDDESVRQIEAIIETLPSTQHSVLMMRQVEHRTNAEIARLLGIGEASVGTLLARARRKMLDEIKRRRANGEL